jgi:hypothetical protein
MTTIAYKDGVLAADTRAFSGSSQPMGQKQKIYRIKHGSIFGVSTPCPGLSEEIKNWFVEAKNLDHEPQLHGREFDMLEIDRAGQVFFYHNSFMPAGPLTAEYFAIGSGAEYALGAMGYGASAVDAVAVASAHDVWTGPTVTMIEIPKPKEAAE